MTTPVLTHACIRLPHTGAIVGGHLAEHHNNGEVTILWAGMRTRGRPITPEEMRAIEEEALS